LRRVCFDRINNPANISLDGLFWNQSRPLAAAECGNLQTFDLTRTIELYI